MLALLPLRDNEVVSFEEPIATSNTNPNEEDDTMNTTSITHSVIVDRGGDNDEKLLLLLNDNQFNKFQKSILIIPSQHEPNDTKMITTIDSNVDNQVRYWGRNDVLIRLYRICQQYNQQLPTKFQAITENATHNKNESTLSPLCSCNFCEAITGWAKVYLPRVMMRCTYCDDTIGGIGDCNSYGTVGDRMTQMDIPMAKVWFKQCKYVQSYTSIIRKKVNDNKSNTVLHVADFPLDKFENMKQENISDDKRKIIMHMESANENNKKSTSTQTTNTKRDRNGIPTRNVHLDDCSNHQWLGPISLYYGDRIQLKAPIQQTKGFDSAAPKIQGPPIEMELVSINVCSVEISKIAEPTSCPLDKLGSHLQGRMSEHVSSRISELGTVQQVSTNNILTTSLQRKNTTTESQNGIRIMRIGSVQEESHPRVKQSDDSMDILQSDDTSIVHHDVLVDDEDNNDLSVASVSSASSEQSIQVLAQWLASQEPVPTAPIRTIKHDANTESTNHTLHNLHQQNINQASHDDKWEERVTVLEVTTEIQRKLPSHDKMSLEKDPFCNLSKSTINIPVKPASPDTKILAFDATATEPEPEQAPEQEPELQITQPPQDESQQMNLVMKKTSTSVADTMVVHKELPSSGFQINVDDMAVSENVYAAGEPSTSTSTLKRHTNLRSDKVDNKKCRVLSRQSSSNGEVSGIDTNEALSRKDESSTDLIVSNERKYILFLLEKGTDMSRLLIRGNAKIEGLKQHCEKRGAVVIESFDKNNPPWPTHIVISENMSSDTNGVAKGLGFDNCDEMSEFLGEHNIVCVTRKWASRGNRIEKPPFSEPTMMEKYLGIWPTSSKLPKEQQKHQRHEDKDVDPHVDRVKCEDVETQDTNHKQSAAILSRGRGVPVRNMKLSELFRTLSKRHKECPFLDTDEWRAYSFQLLAGRLRHLDFDVVDDPTVLSKLRKISGFGSTSIQIIQEYLQTGTTLRLREFEIDKRRIAMKTFMNIWGVGRMRASELVHAGYTTIGSVRHAVKNGQLNLDRNQYIGLQHYEDLLEEMERPEVESIADIVSNAVKERFPSAEITVMGSYRRGKSSCGDVDILITHPDYVDTVPPRALGMIVDDLKSSGYISHHLTFITGMKHELFESLPKSVASKLTSPTHYGRSRDKGDKFSSSSWMGIFHSPVVPGRHRRVDIKFYPYRERIYAALYFTGNGYFNRSMRLWATRKFNWTLSDHGLFDKNTNQSVFQKDPEHEIEVFDKLDMVWKEPSERDCFDAVESKTFGNNEVIQLLDRKFAKHDVEQEQTNYVWVK